MANEISDAKDGLATLLSTISGLRVLDHPADSIGEFPSAVVMFESRNASDTLAGNGFTGELKVVLLVSSSNTKEAYDTLDSFMDPLGANSVEAAINADVTWGGKVDDGRLVSVDNVGRRKLWGGSYIAADFHISFVKGT